MLQPLGVGCQRELEYQIDRNKISIRVQAHREIERVKKAESIGCERSASK